MTKPEITKTKKTYTDLEWPINELNYLADMQIDIICSGDAKAIEKAGIISDVIKLKTQALQDMWTDAFDNHGYLKEVS